MISTFKVAVFVLAVLAVAAILLAQRFRRRLPSTGRIDTDALIVTVGIVATALLAVFLISAIS